MNLRMASFWPMNRVDPGNTGQSTLMGPKSTKLLWEYNPYVQFKYNSTTGVIHNVSIMGNYSRLPNVSCTPLLDSKGTIIYATTDGVVHGLSSTGSSRFNINLNLTAPGMVFVLVRRDDSLVVLGGSRFVHAFFPLECFRYSLVWTFDTGNFQSYFTHSPVMGRDGSIIFGTADNELFSLYQQGSLKWKYKTPNNDLSFPNSPAIDIVTNKVYFSSTNMSNFTQHVGQGSIFGSLFSNGTVNWLERRDVNWMPTGPIVTQSGLVIFSYSSLDMSAAILEAYNRRGKMVWTKDLASINKNFFFGSASSSKSGLLFQGDSSGQLFALETSTGSLVWRVKTSGFIDNSPTIDRDGNVYVTTCFKFMYSFSPLGTLRWRFFTGNGFIDEVYYSSGAIIAPNEVLYVGSTLGSVFAIGDDSPTKSEPNNNSNLILVSVVVALGSLLFVVLILIFSLRKRSETKKINDTEKKMELTDLRSRANRSLTSIPTPTLDNSNISWSNIFLSSDRSVDCILGSGTYGTVVHAFWKSETEEVFEVAVKVLTKSLFRSHSDDSDASFDQMLTRACQEIKLVTVAERRLPKGSENLIKVYGVASGVLPPSFVNLFRLNGADKAVGIVMRFESGGSLETLLFPKIAGTKLPFIEKMRLLTEISVAIADIHGIGIVHGDIKPDNILLSDKEFLTVRLADFGLSRIFQNDKLGVSSLSQTLTTKGTLIYCAPEMLHNPFSPQEQLSKASRKTDMYAFGLLAWEVLTENKAFSEVQSETGLCSIIHQNRRPDLRTLPVDTPLAVIEMITSCWDKDRLKRKTAVECASILLSCYAKMKGMKYDVQLVGCPSDKVVLNQVHVRLTNEGISVCNGIDSTYLVDDSAVTVMFLSRGFQQSEECIHFMEKKANEQRGRIMVVSLEQDMTSWANEDLLGLCSHVQRNPLEMSILSEIMSELNEDDVEEKESDGSFDHLDKSSDKKSQSINRSIAGFDSIVSSVRSAVTESKGLTIRL